ncbi:MAG TPA: WD40 repeat domain-containing protein, partial [Anaerolineae bacterium]|nr:WD40 repeat domain-containing protein [Anaerolineae bacterium]
GRAFPGQLRQPPQLWAGALSVSVFDRASGNTILTLTEHRLAAWASDEVLLAAEAQYNTRLVRCNVRSGARTTSRARDMGDNVYAPGGAYYATMSQRPYAGRGVYVHDAETGAQLCSAYHGATLIHISWSPDGGRIASLASDGTIAVWTVAGKEAGP